MIPGATAKHAIITDTCRSNRGDRGAFDEAVARLRAEYDVLCQVWDGDKNVGAQMHLVLTLERPKAEVIRFDGPRKEAK